MLNGEPALRRRHSGNTFSATGHSATHSDARTVECIGLSAATEATGAKADSRKKTRFGNDPRPAVRPNSTTP